MRVLEICIWPHMFDRQGVLHFAAYFTLSELALRDYIAEDGEDLEDFVVRNAACRYVESIKGPRVYCRVTLKEQRCNSRLYAIDVYLSLSHATVGSPRLASVELSTTSKRADVAA